MADYPEDCAVGVDEARRAHALKQALEASSGYDKDAEVVARAKTFEEYLKGVGPVSIRLGSPPKKDAIAVGDLVETTSGLNHFRYRVLAAAGDSLWVKSHGGSPGGGPFTTRASGWKRVDD